MSVETVKAHLARFGRDGDVIQTRRSTATVDLAAEAFGVEAARIAKTLSFRGPEPGACLLVVTAGDARIDNPAFKARFGLKARMLPAEEVEDLTGHPVGGVCPFALPEGVPVHLDRSLRRFETVFPACGSPRSAIELTPDELELLSGARDWVDVTRH